MAAAAALLGATLGAANGGAWAQSPFLGATPEPVTILDYVGDAMEPFISRDGRLLFFNNRNDRQEHTDLLVAARLNATTFRSLGPVRGANSSALDAVASQDRMGRLYFISTRDYAATLNTIFVGRYAQGQARQVRPVEGLAAPARGRVHFDAEISANGEALYLVDGSFIGGSLPWDADLIIARRYGERRFVRDNRSGIIFSGSPPGRSNMRRRSAAMSGSF
ncbi:MAG: hypothetical protein AB7O04_11270, partial [Hyphomonadaceae bacterium]